MDFCKQIENKPEWFDAVNAALGDVLTACRRTNKKGEVVLKLQVAPMLDKDLQTVVTMQIDVKANCPRHSPGVQTAYLITDEEERAVDLSKDHPAQMAMFRGMAEQVKGDEA